ncbi:MAG TPA: helix-turn-helix domain-containing protein [Chloroflexota bacterium]|nr:helix-turn-helix domain-containing protein [Chloroflexota bacterium]
MLGSTEEAGGRVTAGARGRRLRPVGQTEAVEPQPASGRAGPPDGPAGAEGRYVRIEAVAAYTALTVRHLHDLTRRREIPHIRVGKVVLYDKVAVDEWLSGRQTPPAEWPQWRRPIGAVPARRGAGRGRTR